MAASGEEAATRQQKVLYNCTETGLDLCRGGPGRGARGVQGRDAAGEGAQVGGARLGGFQAEDGRPLRLRHCRRAGVVPALPSILRVAILSSSDAFSYLTSVA